MILQLKEHFIMTDKIELPVLFKICRYEDDIIEAILSKDDVCQWYDEGICRFDRNPCVEREAIIQYKE